MCKFREDSLIESHILRKRVHELLRVFYMLLYGLMCNSVGRSPRRATELLWVPRNLVQSNIHIYCSGA